MAPRKSERILNLTICLLATRRFLAKDQIRQVVEGYRGLSDAAFERTFERDKDELRAMGVPVETGSNSSYFDDELGYRIRRTDFELPPIELDADEAAVVALAAQSWRQSRMASSTRSAWAKLRAAGVETDSSRITSINPTVAAREGAFEVLWQAVLTRSQVRFRYRRGGTGTGEVRTLQPWGVTSNKGRWYVVGHDLDRGAPRMFKMSRIVGQPEVVAGPDAFEVPADVDVRALARSLEPAPATGTAVLAVRADRAPALRRRGRPSSRPLPPELAGAWSVWEVGYADEASLVGEVAACGADVVVLEPAGVRERLLRHLAGVAGAGAVEASTWLEESA
ncbi:WYL domain-containing protein [Auraticoccus sp. F435]|uniref:WYL domain-containing protein n=1 Tax=Auraticoccus cholistanensis TaxID=2656650 RepID=A0A6A9V0H5_9ACTN|nr:WYL domain-containing protein [Auraticoccus cholistanensis]MVA75609.1 WYL domain-containing protein [Auraticoccus cholistanensis]